MYLTINVFCSVPLKADRLYAINCSEHIVTNALIVEWKKRYKMRFTVDAIGCFVASHGATKPISKPAVGNSKYCSLF